MMFWNKKKPDLDLAQRDYQFYEVCLYILVDSVRGLFYPVMEFPNHASAIASMEKMRIPYGVGEGDLKLSYIGRRIGMVFETIKPNVVWSSPVGEFSFDDILNKKDNFREVVR